MEGGVGMDINISVDNFLIFQEKISSFKNRLVCMVLIYIY